MKTPNRTYHLTDLMGNAQRWEVAINKAKAAMLQDAAQVKEEGAGAGGETA